MLKFPPLKPHELPKSLIYKKDYDICGHTIKYFTMIDTHKGCQQAIMACVPAIVSRDGKGMLSLYITYLKSYISGRGYGTRMLNFARKHSENIGYGGYIHLNAVSSLDPMRVPHVFYRKYGMNSGIRSIDKKLDKFIKQGKNATYNDFGSTFMYYPQVKYSKTRMEKFIDKLKIWFGANKF